MGILQVRILVWVSMTSSRGSSQLWDQTQVSCIAGGFFTIWSIREAQYPVWFLTINYLLTNYAHYFLSIITRIHYPTAQMILLFLLDTKLYNLIALFFELNLIFSHDLQSPIVIQCLITYPDITFTTGSFISHHISFFSSPQATKPFSTSKSLHLSFFYLEIPSYKSL